MKTIKAQQQAFFSPSRLLQNKVLNNKTTKNRTPTNNTSNNQQLIDNNRTTAFEGIAA